MRVEVVAFAYIFFLFSSYCTAKNNFTFIWKNIKYGLHSNFYQHNITCTGIGNTIKENKRPGRNVYAIIGDEWPFISLNTEEGGKQVPSDYFGELWQILAKRLHLNTFYIKVPGNRRGLKFSNADISLLPTAMNSDGYDNYDYSQVIAEVWYDLYRRSKGHIDISPLLWSEEVIVISTCLTVLATFFQWFLIKSRIYFGLDVISIKRKESRYAMKRKPTKDIIYESTLAISCLNVLGLILQQGPQIKLKCSSARIVSGGCTLLGLLMNTAYSALLISKITSLEKNVKFEPLSQLPRDWPHSLCMSKKHIVYEEVKKYSAFTTNQQWHTFLNRPPCSRKKKSDHVLAEDYCKTGTVILEMRFNVVQLQKLRSIKCEIVNDNTKYFPTYLALVFRKGFIHKELINQYLIKFYESGIMHKISRKYLKPIKVDEAAILRENYSMSISQVYILYKYFFLAIVVSLCLFSVELICFYASIS